MQVIPQEQELSTLEYQVFQLVNNTVLGYYHHRAILRLMLHTGVRISDALTCEYWELRDDGELTIFAKKNSTLISQPAQKLPPNIGEILDRARIAADRLSYEDIARYIKEYQPRKITTSGKNDLRTHIFRYYYAKKLASQGDTVQTIAQLIGDTTQRTEGYISSKLFKR